MLKKLSVKNFAIIEDLTVLFKEGFNALTGQTGAGKSLIIDSIGLLLGKRADTDMIRYGTNGASVEAVFDYKNPNVSKKLSKYGIKEENEITIYREINNNSKSVIRVNGENVNLNFLKEIAPYLCDIHVQHDTFRLINPDNYLSLLDANILDIDKFKFDYLIALDKYKEAYKEYKEIVDKKDRLEERLDYIIYEHKEISSLELTKNIDVLLNEKISKLSNYDKIYKSLSEGYNALEGDNNSLDNIYNAYKALEKIASYDKSYEDYAKNIESAYYTLDDVKSHLYKDLDNLLFDESELDRLNERLNDIESVCKKYKKSVNELIEYDKKIALEIEMAQDYDGVLKRSHDKVVTLFDDLKRSSLKLSDIRKKVSKKIETEIIKECADLELYDTKFEISFANINLDNPLDISIFSEDGVDKIDFLISLNKGEPTKPLQKCASGGELSRIMLAFKSYFSKVSNLSLMIFDEIDTGVSGSAALKIAEKLRSISKYTQILCITHLPQVAAMADNHLWIYKIEYEGRTITKLSYLDYEDRAAKIASMISGDRISMSSLEAAREMLYECRK